jgi:hypothetical protein
MEELTNRLRDAIEAMLEQPLRVHDEVAAPVA